MISQNPELLENPGLEKIKALEKAADKSEKLGAELTSRAANLEKEISEARAKELGIEDRMEEIAGYLRQQRSTRTLDNRRLLDVQKFSYSNSLSFSVST